MAEILATNESKQLGAGYMYKFDEKCEPTKIANVVKILFSNLQLRRRHKNPNEEKQRKQERNKNKESSRKEKKKSD